MLGLDGKLLASVVLAWSGIVAGNVLGDEKPATARDRLGDPLPLGAVARLGTVRLRGSGDIYKMIFSPDGKWLATLDEQTVRIWSVASGKELAYVAPRNDKYIVQKLNNTMAGLTLSADGKTLVCFGKTEEEPEILLYDLSELSEKVPMPAVLTKPRLAISYPGINAALLAFLPDGKTLLSGDIRGQIHLWDAASGQELRTFVTESSIPYRSALSPDGQTLAVGETSSLVLREVATGKMIGELPGWPFLVKALAFSPDGKRLAASSSQIDAIRLFDVATRKEIRSFVVRKEPSRSNRVGRIAQGLAFAADGKTLVSLGSEGDDAIRIWDVESGELRRSIQGNRGDGGALALSPDGRIAAVASSNGVIRLWDLAPAKELHGGQPQGRVLAVAVSPDNRQVAVGSYDGIVRLYDSSTGAEVRVFATQRSAIRDLMFAPDGKALLALLAYHPAKLWDVASGKEIRAFGDTAGGVEGVRCAGFSADGCRVALAAPEPADPSKARKARSTVIQIVDVADGNVLRRLEVKQLVVDRIAFSADGEKLVGWGFDRAVHLWNLDSDKELWSVHPSTPIDSFAFAPDGETVAVSDSKAAISLLSAANGEVVRLAAATVVNPMVRPLAFSPDGWLFAVAGDNGEIVLLETASGTLVRRLRGHKGLVWSLAFSRDGRRLVSGSDDATALVWDMTGRAFVNKSAAALSHSDLENLWNDLGATDGAKGYGAVWTLLQCDKLSIAFLRTRLLATPDSQTIARLIGQLDDEDFAVREKASTALARMSRDVGTPLKEKLAKKPSAEARRRIEAILDKAGNKDDARLRGLRLIAVLEHTDAPQGRTLLQRLSEKDPSEEIRRAARRALKHGENAVFRP